MSTFILSGTRALALSCAVVVALPAIAPVHAEDLQLDPVTVTASRYERSLSSTPANVTVLEAEELAVWASESLEDILSTQAGVTLARSGGPGQQTSVFMRGNNSDSVLVLVDGVKINGGTFGGANLQNLRGADIARIEIVRGPRSTLYGSEAIGGVISITTRRASADTDATDGKAVDSFSLRGERGGDRTAQIRATATHDLDDKHFAITIGDFRTDGDPVTDATNIKGEHRNTSGALSASTRRGDTRFGFDGSASAGRTRYLDCIYDPFSVCIGTTPLNQDFHNSVASLWSDTSLNQSTNLRARIAHAADEIDQREVADFARTVRLTGTAELEYRRGGNVVIAGVDAEREDVDAIIYGGSLTSTGKNHAAFVRDDLMLGRHQFGVGLRATEYDTFGSQRTGEASYGVQIADHGFGWLAWGRGFRAPDASERFAFGGNPLLEPEKSTSSEAGLRWRIGNHVLTATGFVQEIEDLIDYPAPTFIATNIAEARITGTELGWSWLANATRIDLFATLQDPVDDRTGVRLSRRPEQQLSATARHRLGPVELRAGLLAMDPRDNSAFDAVILPGFAVLDLGVAWTVKPGLVLDARLENAGDIEYTLASGNVGNFMMPDRALFLGFNWQP